MGLHEYNFNDHGFIGSIEATSKSASFRCPSCKSIYDIDEAAGELCYYCEQFFLAMTADEPPIEEHVDTYF